MYPAWYGCINMFKTIVGLALTSVPYAFAKSGYVFGPFLFLFSAFFTAYSLFLLTCCAQKVGQGYISFTVVAQRTYPWLGPVIDILIVATTCGAAITYIILVGGDWPSSPSSDS